MVRGDGPLKITKRVKDNAYKLQLPRDMVVLAMFNVGDLCPYVEDSFKGVPNLRKNPLKEGEVDAE